MEITIVRSKAVPQRRSNESSWPKSYSCNFLEAGAVSYEDVGQGTALLKKETMDTWIQSFVGKPVIIDHQDVDPSNFKKAAVGYITRVWFEPSDGWFWCEFIITDDEGHEAIKDGYSVSCSFDVVDTLPGSEWHAIKYTEEITKGEGLHLALVTSPRYEDCRIVVNSKKAKVSNEHIEITIDTDASSTSEEGVNPFSEMSNNELEGLLRQIPTQMAIEFDTEKKAKLEGDSKLISQELEKRKALGEYKPTNYNLDQSKEEVELIKKNATDFSVMSPIQLDKYMESLSDVGLQTILDGEHPGDIKKLAKAHLGDRAKKAQDEELAVQGGAKPKKKEASKMWKLFAKKADKASIKNDKIDASKVFVKVDDKMVPLSTLMNSVGSDFELLQESDAVRINGKDVKIGDLVGAYKSIRKNDDKKEDDDKKNDSEEEEVRNEDKEKKEEEEEEETKKDDAKGDDGNKFNEEEPKEEHPNKEDAKVHCFKCGKKLSDDDKKRDDGKCNDCFPKKNDDDVEKKEDEKPLPNPQTDEGDTAVKKNNKEFFMDLENAKLNSQTPEGFGSVTAATREDRASNGRKYFGSKKKR